MDDLITNRLEQRLGRLHAKQRLGIEKDHEAQIFGQGINFFHIENWYSIHSLIRNALKLSGIFWRGQRNAEHVQVRHNYIRLQRLPRAFNGFTLLHISDLHVDMNAGAMRRLEELLPDLEYDICVMTGDYRGATFGPFDAALEGDETIAVPSPENGVWSVRQSRYDPHGPRARGNGNSHIA
jgi:uncharacterized protein